MPIVANANFQNPQIGQIATNLATAIWGDPETRMKRDYYGAGMERYAADARKLNAEADIAAGRYRAQQSLTPELMQSLAPLPGETAVQHAMRTAPLLSSLAQYSTDGKNAADASGSVLGNLFAMGTPDEKRTSLVIQGKMPDQNFSGTVADADAVASRNAGYEYKKATAVEGMQQRGLTERTHIEEGGKLSRLFAAPINVSRGSSIYLAPNDPRYGQVGKDGVVEGAPTVNTVRGEAGRKILALPEDQEPPSNLASIFSGKVGSGAASRPRVVNGKALSDAVLSGARRISGAVDLDTNPAKPTLRPEFEASFDAALVARARQAASDELAKSGNIERAGTAYTSILNVRPGDTFESYGLLGRLFGHQGHVNAAPRPFGPVVAPAPTPRPQRAPEPPTVTSPDQLPPPAKRPVGFRARSSKGLAEWNGRGWVLVPNESAY